MLELKSELSEATKATRRRSFKTLLQIPRSLSSRSSECRSLSKSRHVGSIPADIILEVVDLLSPLDVLNFSLTVSLFHTSHIILPI